MPIWIFNSIWESKIDPLGSENRYFSGFHTTTGSNHAAFQLFNTWPTIQFPSEEKWKSGEAARLYKWLA